MIQAFKKDQALLSDIHSALSNSSLLHIWWLGQSGYLLKWKDIYVLVDPYLSDSLTHKYAQTDKPHVRMSEQVIDPEKLDFINVVSSSHNHTDHLDGDTLIPLLSVNSDIQFIIPEANRAFVQQRVKCPEDFPIGLNEGEKVELTGDLKIYGIPAAHNDLERDEEGRCKYMGYVFQLGPFYIYHSGDTLWRQEIVDALNPFQIDIALLPINGNKPERRVAGNLNAREAVQLAQVIGAKWVIPCHYHMFTFNTVDPDEFERIAEEKGQPYQILRGGERFTYSSD